MPTERAGGAVLVRPLYPVVGGSDSEDRPGSDEPMPSTSFPPPGRGTDTTSRAAAVQSGTPDTHALEHLQRVHRPVLLAYITRLTKGDVHWAEDILQETLVRAWKNPDARNAEGRWNRAWLFTVARRITIDQVRAAQVRPAEYFDERLDAHAGADDAIERMLEGKEVRAALSTLPERLRTILVEIYFQERSVAEAAEILDVPTGTVKSRTFYALRALREALAERGFTFREAADS